MALRLYADECVDARIVASFRRRGVDILTAEEQGLLSASDGRQMGGGVDLESTSLRAVVN